jgi:hypothetical protein
MEGGSTSVRNVLGANGITPVLRTYVDHYNRKRPHRALGLTAPDPPGELISLTSTSRVRVSRTDRLGGLLHEYQRAA